MKEDLRHRNTEQHISPQNSGHRLRSSCYFNEFTLRFSYIESLCAIERVDPCYGGPAALSVIFSGPRKYWDSTLNAAEAHFITSVFHFLPRLCS
jgi:hypothetical protein